MEDKQLSILVLLALTVGAMYLTYLVFRPFLAVLFVAVVLAIGFSPLHRGIRRRIGSSTAAALITTAFVILIMLVPFILLSARFIGEVTRINSSVVKPFGNAANWPHRLDPWLERAAHETGVPEQRLRSEITARAGGLGTRFVQSKVAFARRFVQSMTTIALGCVFLFPLLRGSDEFRSAALSMLPLSPHRARELAVEIGRAHV